VTVALPFGKHRTLLIPRAAVRLEGDLNGVTLRTSAGNETRWVRLGSSFGELVEVGSGLRPGDRVVVPDPRAVTASLPAEDH
jgi:hypothetical protein